jgi:hypothetical protein
LVIIMDALEKAFHVIRPDRPAFFCGRSKRPTLPGGFHNAKNTPEALRILYEQAPGDLIGVPTGISFVVIDPDLQHREARQWWKANKDRLPITRMHRTRSGGWHILFKPHPLFCNGHDVHPKVNAKGVGGYIIWWPAEGCAVFNADVLADVPDWIIAAMPPPGTVVPARAVAPGSTVAHLNVYLNGTRSAEAALAGILRKMATARNGERQRLTYWCANRVFEMIRDGELHHDAADALAYVALNTGLAASRVREVMRRVERTVLS